MRFMKMTMGCVLAAAVAVTGFSMRLAHADEPTPEEELHVHRLKSEKTSPYDAFAYLNRIAMQPSEGQPPAEYAGTIIYSRLANIEGRIQVKGVEGFQLDAYQGYKTFLRAWPDVEGVAVGNCVVCHTPDNFTNGKSYVVDLSGEAKETPSLRDLRKSDEELKAILEKKVQMAEKARADDSSIDEAYKLIKLNEADIDNLVVFLQSLDQVPEDHFREIVVDANILDTSDIHEL